MCGIAGIITKEKESNETNLKDMLLSLKHRGPDNQGMYLNNKENLNIGMRRLSVIDIDTGNQPIFNEKKTIGIVLNGEIYNFKELRSQLKNRNHHFSTNSDTEVLIHLYEDLGKNFVKKLNGMFSFCLFDLANRKLVFAVDRVGKKPFYYYHNDSVFAFSSEIKAITKIPQFKFEENEDAMNKYFIFGFIPSPHTPYKNLFKLTAGSLMEYDLDTRKTQIFQYWDMKFNQSFAEKDESELIELIDSELENSVKRRLIADVPIGCFLSGGLDSSLILAKMRQIQGNGKLNTFSIGFEEKYADESEYATAVSKQFDTDHHHRILSKDDFFKVIDDYLPSLDEPIADPSIIPTYFLSKLAREKVTVAISGDGGDEMFGGYPKYRINSIMSRIGGNLPTNWMIKTILGIIPTNPGNRILNYKVMKFASTLDYSLEHRNQLWVGSFTPIDMTKLKYGFNSESQKYFEDVDKYSKQFGGKDVINKMMYLDTKLMLKDAYLAKVDRASMACSLEVRSPFLDTNMVELSGTIPSSLKVGKKGSKYLLKKIAERYLPEKIIYRPKRGFGIPLAKWISDKRFISRFEKITLSMLPRYEFDRGYINKLVENHLSGKQDNSTMIWTIFIYANWRMNYL